MTLSIDPRIVEEFNRRAPFKMHEATLLVLATIGSESHNTYVPSDDPNSIDDRDFMAIVVPPPSYVIGVRQWEGINFQRDELDVVVYSFRKFVSLLLKSNPNVLGLLWLRPEHYVVYAPEWAAFLQKRRAFSSKEAYPSFAGYAHGQLKRMTAFDIRTQNEWDEAVAVIESAGWTKEQIVANAHLAMPSDLHVPGPDDANEYRTHYHDRLNQLDEAKITIRRIHARHFQGYMGEKRKRLVRKYGYDTKNAAHLIRLLRMCVEYLGTGELRVYRDADGDDIRAIKQGALSLEAVQAEANALFAQAAEIVKQSPLPDGPDIDAIDALTRSTHLSAWEHADGR